MIPCPVNSCTYDNLNLSCNQEFEVTDANLDQLIEVDPALEVTNLTIPNCGKVNASNSLDPLNMIDKIANNQLIIQKSINNPNQFGSIEDKLRLQQTLGEYAINSAVLSKIVGTTTKSIDSLIHVQ